MPVLKRFEFHTTLHHLDEGLNVLHASVQLLRESTGLPPHDRNLMLFETALAEICANVLTHGRPLGSDYAVEYVLRLDEGTALASFTDHGPPVHDHLAREMPDPLSESGRGLAMARSLLDQLGYVRERDTNKWRLVKHL